MRISDRSSDVCSSDLHVALAELHLQRLEDAREIGMGARRKRQFVKGDERGFLELPPIGADQSRRIVLVGFRRAPEGPQPLFVKLDDGRSAEHTYELQSLMRISYAVFCLKKNTNNNNHTSINQV